MNWYPSEHFFKSDGLPPDLRVVTVEWDRGEEVLDAVDLGWHGAWVGLVPLRDCWPERELVVIRRSVIDHLEPISEGSLSSRASVLWDELTLPRFGDWPTGVDQAIHDQRLIGWNTFREGSAAIEIALPIERKPNSIRAVPIDGSGIPKNVVDFDIDEVICWTLLSRYTSVLDALLAERNMNHDVLPE